jgi:prepilin-type N-terminal cleavage/methylation domain-containing protein
MGYFERRAVADRTPEEGKDPSAGGFTLIEVLIAIALTALIAAIMGSAIRLGIRSVAAGEKKAELVERFKNSLGAMDAQVEAEIPMLYRSNENARRFCFSGDRTHTSFASNYAIWRGTEGYVMVEYRIDEDAKGKQVMHASERLPGTEVTREVKLLDGLDEAYFEYFYRDNRVPAGMWVDQWTDPLGIPEKMRLHLTQGKKRLSMIMTLRARGYVDWIMSQDMAGQ